MYVNAVMTHQITHFGTLYAESLLMNVKHVFLTITQGGLRMIGKDFIHTKTRCLLNEYIELIAEKTDNQRQKFLH